MFRPERPGLVAGAAGQPVAEMNGCLRASVLSGYHARNRTRLTGPLALLSSGGERRCRDRTVGILDGLDREAYNAAEIEEVQAMMQAAVPQTDREFLQSFEDMIAIGDYLFVHAGIAPDVPIEEQRRQDLRWIREPFLSHEGRFGAIVVHGHTICDDPEDCGNRIGVDTGAYISGRLTALVLEGTQRRYLEAVDADGAITAAARQLAA